MRHSLIGSILALFTGIPMMMAAADLLTPAELWKDYDPDKGAYEEEIVKQWDQGTVHYKDFYISAYVNGEKIRMFCKYAAEKSPKKLPAMLCIHGSGGQAFIEKKFIEKGYVVLSYDYTGEMKGREYYSIFPKALEHGNKNKSSWLPSSNAKSSSVYIWYAMARRALSYMATLPEVDSGRMGAYGVSVGGTMIWQLATDKRLKAVSAFYGCGWNTYYRSFYKYQLNAPVPKNPTEQEQIDLSALAPQAYASGIHCPVLYLSGSNDHHGTQDRSYDTLDLLPKDTPWACAQQVRGMHDLDDVVQDLYLWMDKWVKGETMTWPKNPNSEITIGTDGIPIISIHPDCPNDVESIEIYYALHEPYNLLRNWRDAKSDVKENAWTAKLPVIDVNQYLFAYANIRYKSSIVLSTKLEAVVPSRIGKAMATDKRSNILYQGSDGKGCFGLKIELAEGPDGVKGFKPLRNTFFTYQTNDPKWIAPKNAKLTFKVYAQEKQKIKIATDGNNNYSCEFEVSPSNTWQTIVIEPQKLERVINKKITSLPSWAQVKKIEFSGNIQHCIFTDFSWVF